MTPSSEQRECREAAIHEASHAEIVRQFGGVAFPRIERNTTPGERAWIGDCRFCFDEKPADHQMRLIGFAGLVGELLDEGCDLIEIIDEIQTAIFADDGFSKSDRADIGANWSDADIEKTVEMLTANWADIRREASAMIEISNYFNQ